MPRDDAYARLREIADRNFTAMLAEYDLTIRADVAAQLRQIDEQRRQRTSSGKS